MSHTLTAIISYPRLDFHALRKLVSSSKMKHQCFISLSSWFRFSPAQFSFVLLIWQACYKQWFLEVPAAKHHSSLVTHNHSASTNFLRACLEKTDEMMGLVLGMDFKWNNDRKLADLQLWWHSPIWCWPNEVDHIIYCFELNVTMVPINGIV